MITRSHRQDSTTDSTHGGNIASPPKPVKHRLWLFLVGSAVLHGASLVVQHPPAWSDGYSETVLSVGISEPNTGARTARVELETQVSADDTAMPHADAAERTDASTPAAPPPWTTPTAALSPDASTSSAATAASGEDGLEQARARIQASLHAILARYFEYPYLARLRGWEGQVLLAFHITGDGHMQALRVARSSGFAVLDASALHSLGKVERLNEARTWLNGRGVDMQLPVIYRLVEN